MVLDDHVDDGDDEEESKFSTGRREEDEGAGVLLLPGAGDGVVEVAEVAVAVLACSVLLVVLHGAPATASCSAISSVDSEKKKGREIGGARRGGGEEI